MICQAEQVGWGIHLGVDRPYFWQKLAIHFQLRPALLRVLEDFAAHPTILSDLNRRSGTPPLRNEPRDVCSLDDMHLLRVTVDANPPYGVGSTLSCGIHVQVRNLLSDVVSGSTGDSMTSIFADRQ